MKFFVSVFLLIQSLDASEHCFPKNNYHHKSFQKGVSKSIDHYKDLERKFFETFNKLLKEKYHKKLIINSFLDNPKVNASITRDDADNPVMNVYGGLIRHPDLTDDGIWLILCHELGHYLGGAPKSFRGRSEKRSWSSIEGQADYFASTKCLPKLFRKYPRNLSNNEKQIDNLHCQDQVCLRIILAGLSAAKMFASLKDDWESPKLTKKDHTIVRSTNHGHPRPQCRLDTYVSASYCENDPDIQFDSENPNIGACLSHSNNEFSLGARPFCWYRPQID